MDNSSKKGLSSNKMKIVSICALLVSAVLLISAVSHTNQFFGGKSAKEASVFNRGQTYNSSEDIPVQSITKTTKVIPMGTSFGIKLFTDGIIVASLTDIQDEKGYSCPAKDAGIKPGDYIVSAAGQKIENNSELAGIIGKSGGSPVEVVVRRGEKTFETEIKPVFSGGAFRSGMWIRDSAAGIGTLTFYNPDAGVFAGLGHGICDMDTSDLMSLDHGEPAAITLCGIVPGKKDSPGQLQGYFASDEPLGKLLANNETGVYGRFDEIPQGELMEVLPKEEVKTGDVKLLVSIDDTGPQLYDARIDKINPKDQMTQNFLVVVTDERLLSATGGIVQGMSGCPIIQDGKLAGAVTHVFIDNPTTGYGIYSETMVVESVVFSMSD